MVIIKMIKTYFKLISLFLVTISMVTAYAIDNPDSPDLIADFHKRSIVHENAINNPTNTNRGYLIAYDDYRIFLDKELNKAYKLVMSKLPKAQKAELKKSQRNWIKYHDAEFEFIKNNWTKSNFGSSSSISRGAYRNSVIESRILQLLHYAKNY